MAPDELLARLAWTMRRQVGPQVGDEFARTQAFMAAVILEKLAGQVRSAEEHNAAQRAELAALVADLEAQVRRDDPQPVHHAIDQLRVAGPAGLGPLVAALWDGRAALGEDRSAALLGRVRTVLRARVDRQMEYAA